MVGLGLLLAVIALDLGKVYISVRINAWNNAFYNAVQAFNSGELPSAGHLLHPSRFRHCNVCVYSGGSPDRRRSLSASGEQYTYLPIWSGQH
jgi:hypothetical protein